MQTIKSVYKIGHGPSSSHTVGPYRAARLFGARYPHADSYRVTLYGSLAFTGEGHGTKKAIMNGLPGAEVVFDRDTADLPHPNTMLFEAIRDGEAYAQHRIFSVGGGSIRIEGEASDEDREVYPQRNLTEMIALCNERKISMVARVAINAGISRRPTSIPFRSPSTAPKARLNSSVRSTLLVILKITTEKPETIASMEPTDRSISPVRQIIPMPTAIIPTAAEWRRIFIAAGQVIPLLVII